MMYKPIICFMNHFLICLERKLSDTFYDFMSFRWRNIISESFRTLLMKYQLYHPGPVTSTNKYYFRYCELICYLFVIMNNV